MKISKKCLEKNPSGAKDLIIMFNFMKMLDPDSVVREGEQLLLKKNKSFLKNIRHLLILLVVEVSSDINKRKCYYKKQRY